MQNHALPESVWLNKSGLEYFGGQEILVLGINLHSETNLQIQLTHTLNILPSNSVTLTVSGTVTQATFWQHVVPFWQRTFSLLQCNTDRSTSLLTCFAVIIIPAFNVPDILFLLLLVVCDICLLSCPNAFTVTCYCTTGTPPPRCEFLLNHYQFIQKLPSHRFNFTTY